MDKGELPPCQYGQRCFRKNPAHFREFSHQLICENPEAVRHDRPPSELPGGSGNNPAVEPSPVQQKFSLAKRKIADADVVDLVAEGEQLISVSPVPFHLTKVRGIDDVFNENCYSLKGFLAENSVELIASCQFDYMIDIPWLMDQYTLDNRSKPLLIVTGCRNSNISTLRQEALKFPNISIAAAPIPDQYGTHHTKMMILHYTSGIKIVIHTANLVVQDWDQKTQGMYISPLLPIIPSLSEAAGDSDSHFKRDLLDYLQAYRLKQLQSWVKLLQSCDMSQSRVFIIASVPGRHRAEEQHKWGHMKLRRVLTDHCQVDRTAQPRVVAQFSSIGSLGQSADKWLTGEFLTSLSSSGGNKCSTPPQKKKKGVQSALEMSLIFPSVKNVRCSLEGYPAGGSIPYSSDVAKKQLWLEKFFCQWVADHTERSRASPHIKSYLRCSQNCRQVGWFLLSSSNLSKAAWGALEKSSTQLFIRSWELGVLFLPQYVTGQDTFDSSVMPFDLPPQPYKPSDSPWVWDVPHVDEPDCNGNAWLPS